MMKRLLVLIAFCGMTLHLTSCTSTDSKQDSEAVGEFDSSELEKVDGQDPAATASTDATAAPSSEGGDSSLTSDKLPEEALGESPAASTETAATDPNAATAGEVNMASPPAETPATTDTAATDVMPPAPDASSAPSAVAENSSLSSNEPPAAAPSSDVTNIDPSTTKSAPASAPLQKVAAAPWTVGKVLANTVYFARPGDTLANVSQMIYGADKTSELKKINPTYKNRSLKPGDKVYYNSPHRPDDASKVISFYEDNGMPPEIYTTKPGDNIRKVSKELLGYDGAWKEVWASNSVDSKGNVDGGIELKYWKGGAVAAAPAAPAHQEMAGNDPNAAAPAMPPAEQAPPPPAPDQAQMDLPPPPPMPQEATPPPPPPPADMAQATPPPPPPPPAHMDLPPPPSMAMEKQNGKMGEAAGGMDNDTTLALAVVGLAAAGLAVLIVMRKKRKQREMDTGLNGDTQVGT